MYTLLTSNYGYTKEPVDALRFETTDPELALKVARDILIDDHSTRTVQIYFLESDRLYDVDELKYVKGEPGVPRTLMFVSWYTDGLPKEFFYGGFKQFESPATPPSKPSEFMLTP